MKLEADALDHAGSANYAHRPLLSTHQTSALMSKKERRQTQSKRQKNAAAATATSAVEWQANKIKRYNAHTQCNAVAVDSEHCCRMESPVGIVHPRFDVYHCVCVLSRLSVCPVRALTFENPYPRNFISDRQLHLQNI